MRSGTVNAGGSEASGFTSTGGSGQGSGGCTDDELVPCSVPPSDCAPLAAIQASVTPSTALTRDANTYARIHRRPRYVLH